MKQTDRWRGRMIPPSKPAGRAGVKTPMRPPRRTVVLPGFERLAVQAMVERHLRHARDRDALRAQQSVTAGG